MEEKREIKIICLICGDVSKGHPAMDKLAARLLDNGFTTTYSNEPKENQIGE